MKNSNVALRRLAEGVKGFLTHEEGEALFAAAVNARGAGPLLEIGSYCGKSAVYLGSAARRLGVPLFTVDHHRGSEEIQPGWADHDPETWDAEAGAMETLPFLRRTLRKADLEEHVIPIVGRSATVARWWRTPLRFLFIDGGHGAQTAWGDYRGWAAHLAPGGVLAIHDVFPDPKDGGRPPFEIWEAAEASGLFEGARLDGSLGFLTRRD